MSPGLSRVRRVWHRLSDEHPDDPIPRQWVGISLIGSALDFAAALVFDGKDFHGYDFFVNAMASLLLLGPGLLLTNVVAARWRLRRQTDRQLASMTPAIQSLCRVITNRLVAPSMALFSGAESNVVAQLAV